MSRQAADAIGAGECNAERVNDPHNAQASPEADGSGSKWASSVVLGSGDTAYIRPLTTADKEALQAFHQRQSAESIYRRFFSPKPTLSERELEHFTNVDMVDRVALVVESQDQFVAWASYERWPGRNEAEAAFMVDDDFHGRGIATLLLEHLAAIAHSNGIERFTAEVLGDNRGMLAVFAKAGWPLQRRFDSGVVDLDWDIASTEEFLDSVERREQRADSRAITRILLPKAIAVVGASDRPDSVGSALWTHIAQSAVVPAYPVNPNRATVAGQHCYRSVDELPDDVSLAIIAVPPAALDSTIDACIDKRMRGAIVITDIDGSDVDIAALVLRSRRHGLRIIGPSSMGAASPQIDSRLQAALVDVALAAGPVAISLQSGSLGGSVLRQARDLQLGVSWFVSLGDKSDVSGNDLLQFWEDDDHTRVIAMYTESFGNPRKFARIARRVSRTRPIVAVRTGAAADGTLSSALFQQAGLIEVPTVNALLDTARVLATQPVMRGDHVAVITNSRSPATLAESALSVAGLTCSIQHLGVAASPDDFRTAASAALASDAARGVLVIHAPAVASDVDSAISEAIDEVGTGTTKPVVAVVLGGADGPVRRGSDVPNFSFPEQAAAVLGRSSAYGRWLDDEASTDDPPTTTIDPDAAQQLIATALGAQPDGAPVHADIGTALALLATYGIAVADGANATPDTAVDVARSIGYPVAVKATERSVGRSVKAGIALDLTDDDDVTTSIAQMREAIGDAASSLVVQKMAAPGFDVRIRCEHDERLGVIISVGIGGAHATVIADSASRLAPVSRSSALTMIAETKVAAALADSDINSEHLVDAVCRAALLASDQPQLVELDLNPIIVTSESAVVTDAAATLRAHDQSATPLRRLE
jgi:acyl-CoA synthetase (NDP forming)/GNAT superfamily N-acetyltransferase